MLAGYPLRLRLRRTCWTFVVLLAMTLPLALCASELMVEYPVWKMVPYMQCNAFILGVTALWSCVCGAVVQASSALAATLRPGKSHCALLSRPDTVRAHAHRLLWLRVEAVLGKLGSG